MRKVSAVVALILVLTCTGVVGAAGDLPWLTLKQGMERAKEENKAMIVDFFYGKGCARCEFLETKVYGDPGIAEKIRTDFIPVRIELRKALSPEEEALGRKYDYKNECLLLILDPQGNVLTDPDGSKFCFADSIDPDQFIRYLDWYKRSR